MNCPWCKIGLIIFVPANPPAPGHYRCLNESCRHVFKNDAIKELRKQEEAEKRRMPTMETETAKNTEAKVREKTCSKCEKTYPATNVHFSRNASTPDGLERWCKTCKNAAAEIQRKNKNKGNTVKAAKRARRTRRTEAKPGGPTTTVGPSFAAIPACVQCRAGVAKEICNFIMERFAA